MAYEPPTQRQPKGDHNRRLSLGLDPDDFAAEAGITTEQLRDYERTSPDHRFDAAVAQRVGETLERLEAVLPNSQTGRQHTAGEATPDDVGQAPPTEDPSNQAAPRDPRYTAAASDGAPSTIRPMPPYTPRQPANTGSDLPGADGQSSAGADKDTYD
ncbi:hypothetical protein [uncultured Devosia sp.]|uniref:hypothetical protein n=1 Tax=uncultured Devosia sp. TaxID=211434 RepID=UPI0035CC0763